MDRASKHPLNIIANVFFNFLIIVRTLIMTWRKKKKNILFKEDSLNIYLYSNKMKHHFRS